MSVELALQKAIVAKLKADDVVAGDRVFDNVPIGAARPYVHYRSIQVVDESADCILAYRAFIDIDVWSDSTGSGKVEASSIASKIRLALDGVELILDEPYALVEISHQNTQVDNQDGLLTRGGITFEALVEQT
jgi:hypothetical protein